MAFLLIHLPTMRKLLFDFTTGCSNGYLIFCHVETTPLSTRNLFFQSVDSKQIARSRAVELTSVIYDLPRIDNPVSANYSRSKTEQQILRMKLNLDFSSLRSDTRKKFTPIAQVLQRDLIPRLLISRGDFSPEYHVYTGATMKMIGAKIYLVQRDRNNKLRFIRILRKFKYNPRFLPAVRVSSRLGIMTFQSPLNRMKLNGALFGVKLFESIQRNLNPEIPVLFWTDSEILFQCIKIGPSTGSVYFDRRLVWILEKTSQRQWRFLSQQQKPLRNHGFAVQSSPIRNLENLSLRSNNSPVGP